MAKVMGPVMNGYTATELKAMGVTPGTPLWRARPTFNGNPRWDASIDNKYTLVGYDRNQPGAIYVEPMGCYKSYMCYDEYGLWFVNYWDAYAYYHRLKKEQTG